MGQSAYLIVGEDRSRVEDADHIPSARPRPTQSVAANIRRSRLLQSWRLDRDRNELTDLHLPGWLAKTSDRISAATEVAVRAALDFYAELATI